MASAMSAPAVMFGQQAAASFVHAGAATAAPPAMIVAGGRKRPRNGSGSGFGNLPDARMLAAMEAAHGPATPVLASSVGAVSLRPPPYTGVPDGEAGVASSGGAAGAGAGSSPRHRRSDSLGSAARKRLRDAYVSTGGASPSAEAMQGLAMEVHQPVGRVQQWFTDERTLVVVGGDKV